MNEQVKLNVFYPYPAEKVWQAITDCRILDVWMMKNDFKPRIGHKFKFERESLPGIKTIIHCEVLELEKPKRLIYTWQDEITSEPSLVIWTLTSVEGGTQLQLKHQQTGYATTVIGDRSRNIQDRPGLFLYQETRLNCDRQISEIGLRQRVIRDELNIPLDYRNFKEEWNYRLNSQLARVLQSYC
ncbi:MAG: SRPBCC domain-containing protein [Pleurocapsa sp. MO_226.B13]|nr:SRPBCC domain-containing protein [Pleurocapsa sp. MO_226.B13]